MISKYFTKRAVALGLSTLCIGNSLSDIFKARAVLTREALLSVQEAMEKCQAEIDPKLSARDEYLQTEVEKNKDKVKTAVSEIQNINSDNIDWSYLRYLDLAKGAVLERTGVLHDIRFFNGFIKEITVNDNNMRQFKNDSGIGFAEVMTALFPSPTGELAVGNNIDMSPELMAKIFGLLYMLRERHIVLPAKIDEKITYLMNLAKQHNRTKENVLLQVKNLSDAKNVLEKKLAELKELEKEISVESTEDIEQKSEKERNKIQRATKKAKQRIAKIPEIQTALIDIDAYIKIEDLLNTKSRDKNGDQNRGRNETRNVVRPEKRKAFLKLLYDLSVTINDQEGTEETASDDRPLKQYTAENVLLAYFVKKFDTKEEVSEFYRALPEQIKLSGDKTSEVTREDVLSEVKKLHDMLEKAMPKSNIPYDSNLLSNGRAIQTVVGEDGQCCFDKTDGFADCVDTSIRHLVNLMTYNANDEKFHLPGSTCDITNQDLDELLNAYRPKNKIKHKSVKERLHMYYLYQTQQLANNGDKLTRSLWNHVVSNISSKDEGMYDVVYMKKKNELSAGLVNVLKICYNLVYALRDGQGCEEAKIAIDKVISIINSVDKIKECDVTHLISDAFQKTLKLFNDDYELKIDVKEVQIQKKSNLNDPMMGSWMDAFGAVCVTVRQNNNNLFSFEINQQIGHGATRCNVQNKITLVDEEKHLLENEYAALLYNYSNQLNKSNNITNTIYHKSATGFILRSSAFNEYNEKIGHWIDEDNVIGVMNGLVGISYDEINGLNLRVNCNGGKQNKQVPLAEWVINVIYSNEKSWNYSNVILWYVLNVLPTANVKHEQFEQACASTIEKNKIILEILKKKELSVTDVNMIKDLNLDVFGVKNPYGTMLDCIVRSKNEVVEKVAECIPLIRGTLASKLANAHRWDIVELLLEKYSELGEYNDFVLTLIKQEKFDLLCKFKNKINFNITHDTEEVPVYIFLDRFIKDPEVRKKLICDVSKLASKDGKITLDDVKDLTKSEFFRDSKLTEKCINDLSDEDFTNLIDKYQLAYFEKQRLLNIALRVKQWSKAKNFLDEQSACVLSDQEIKCILESGDKSLKRALAEILKKVTRLIDGHLVSDYVRNVVCDEEFANMINPENKLYKRIMEEKSFESIPVYDDVVKYFEVNEGTTIAALAIQYLSDDDFKRFLKERLTKEKIKKYDLFNRVTASEDLIQINFVCSALVASLSKLIIVLDYDLNGDISRNSFIIHDDEAVICRESNALELFDTMFAERDGYEEAKKKLQDKGLLF